MVSVLETSNRKPRMLVADDDPSIVNLIVERCTKIGFEVESASNGIQAMLRANRTRPDILVIDVNMPKADGLSVCEHLLDPANKSFEVIVVTGSRDPETVRRCGGWGAFYTHKGPNFWFNFTSALIEVFPGMAARIEGLKISALDLQVKSRPRVLVVDDDTDMKAFFSNSLDRRGVEMLFASDATKAYKIACTEGPSVIVSDYFMPNGDATYLLWKLRSEPPTQKVPVIVLSGRQLDEPTQRILKRDIYGWPGASRIFQKSFHTRELFGALQLFCGFEPELV